MKVLLQRQLSPSDPDAISSFLAEVRKALAGQGGTSIRIALVREEDDA